MVHVLSHLACFAKHVVISFIKNKLGDLGVEELEHISRSVFRLPETSCILLKFYLKT